MKRLLNTLFVTTQGTYLARVRETVLVRVNKETKIRLPIHTLDGIICFGRVSLSPGLMELCGRSGVSVSFMSESGRFRAGLRGPVSGNVLLRRQQYRLSDNHDTAAEIARALVAAKVANCRQIVLRARRDRPDSPGVSVLSETAGRLALILEGLKEKTPLEIVRGREGEAARIYFTAFDELITAQKEVFIFGQRSRRPPLNEVNCLLSFLYTILTHDVRSALEGVGLDPAVGYLHRDRPGRPGLALDLMEELRPYLADRLALSLINRRQVGPSGFQKTETGAVLMTDDTRKSVIMAYQKRKQEELIHPFLGEKMAVGLLPIIQATLFSRFLRGDLDIYPPFFWR